MDNILKQKIETLNGDRGSPDDAAARLKHVRALVSNLPAEQASRYAVGATPTKAEHDALVDDVQKLFSAFNALRVLLR